MKKYMQVINEQKEKGKMLFLESQYDKRSTERDIKALQYIKSDIPKTTKQRNVMRNEIIIELDKTKNAVDELKNPNPSINLSKLQLECDDFISNMSFQLDGIYWITDHRIKQTKKTEAKGVSRHLRFLIDDKKLTNLNQDEVLAVKQEILKDLLKKAPLNIEMSKWLKVDMSFFDTKNKLCPFETGLHEKYGTEVKVVSESLYTYPVDFKDEIIIKAKEKLKHKAEIVNNIVFDNNNETDLSNFNIEGFSEEYKKAFAPSDTIRATMFFSGLCKKFNINHTDSVNLFISILNIYQKTGYSEKFNSWNETKTTRIDLIKRAITYNDNKISVSQYWDDTKTDEENKLFIRTFVNFFDNIKKTQEDQEVQGDYSQFNSHDIDDLFKMDIPEPSFLINDVLPEEGCTIFGGDSGSAKSFMAMQASLCIATGNDFLGKDVEKGGVFYIDEENRLITLKDRFKKLMNGLDIKQEDVKGKLRFYVSNNLKIQGTNKFNQKLDPEVKLHKDYLNSEIEKHKPKLIIFDSLVRFFTGDENSSQDVREVFQYVKDLITRHKVSVIILHHTTKNSYGKHSLRGSGDLTAGADIVMMNAVTKDGSIICEQSKNRHAEKINPMVINFKSTEDSIKLIYSGERTKKKSKSELCYEAIKFWFYDRKIEEFATKNCIDSMKRKSFGASVVKNAIKMLSDEEIITKKAHGFYSVDSEKLHNQAPETDEIDLSDDKKIEVSLFIESNPTNNVDDLYDKFGEDYIDRLSREGEIIRTNNTTFTLLK